MVSSWILLFTSQHFSLQIDKDSLGISENPGGYRIGLGRLLWESREVSLSCLMGSLEESHMDDIGTRVQVTTIHARVLTSMEIIPKYLVPSLTHRKHNVKSGTCVGKRLCFLWIKFKHWISVFLGPRAWKYCFQFIEIRCICRSLRELESWLRSLLWWLTGLLFF